jgi:hypothetical protein
MVAEWTLKVLATALMDRPSRTSSRAKAFCSGSSFWGLPNATPRSLAACRPSSVRVNINERSKADMSAKTALTVGPDRVFVSAYGSSSDCKCACFSRI